MSKYYTLIVPFFLIVNGWSFHPTMDRYVLNENNNNVVGFEYQATPKTSMTCTKFVNSFYTNENHEYKR